MAAAHPRSRHLTSEEILDVAGRLFAAQGYGNTSVREIATAAGVTSSTLYGQFASKEAMLVAFLDRVYERSASMLRSALLDIEASSATEQLAELTRRMTGHWLVADSLAKLALVELERLPPPVTKAARALRDETVQVVADVIARGFERGEFLADRDALSLAWTIRGLVNELALWGHRLAQVPPDMPPLVASCVSRIAGHRHRRVPRRAGVKDVEVRRRPSPAEISTRDRLLLAARTRFARHGSTQVSMRDIAADVGIRAPSIYAHFDSKDHLVGEVVEAVARARLSLLREVLDTSSTDWVERLVACTRALGRDAVADPDGVIVSDDELLRVPPEHLFAADAIDAEFSGLLVDLVESGRRAGAFRFSEPTGIVARAVLALPSQLAWRARFVHRLDPDEAANDVAGDVLGLVDADG